MNHTAQQIPATENEAWGFWGTIGHRADPQRAWPLAVTALAEATGEEPEAVRPFLDSRHGRHFADEVINALHAGQPLEQAIQTVTHAWANRTVGRSTSKTYGIPLGMSYLAGFVIQEGFEL